MADKVTDKIVIGGEIIEIKKLKAGKFYELQKLFAEVLGTISGAQGKDVIEGQKEEDFLSNLLTSFPKKTAEIVAFCSEKEIEDILNNAYPEEIPIAFEKCLALNNVFENLKNYVAPMEKMVSKMNQKE